MNTFVRQVFHLKLIFLQRFSSKSESFAALGDRHQERFLKLGEAVVLGQADHVEAEAIKSFI